MFKLAQPVSAHVQDGFGLVDPSAFKATLIGTLNTGAAYNQTITSQLAFVSPDAGQDYLVSGSLNPLAEGVYTLSLHAQDLAENDATPDPLKSSFRIDVTPPAITLSQTGSTCTSQSPLKRDCDHYRLVARHYHRYAKQHADDPEAGLSHQARRVSFRRVFPSKSLSPLAKTRFR